MTALRYELKFALDEAAFAAAQSWIHTRLPVRRAHPDRQVSSLYFDTPDFKAARENLSGLADRRKVRLRWYGDGPVRPGLETKKRIGRLGSKERIDLPELQPCASSVQTLVDALHSALGPGPGSGVPLIPTLYVSYRRRYLADGLGLRVTLDEHIQYGLPDVYRSLDEVPAISVSQRVMELKFAPAEKDRVAALLRRTTLTPQRHSKYLMGLARCGCAVYI
jgi:hypothetical protein